MYIYLMNWLSFPLSFKKNLFSPMAELTFNSIWKWLRRISPMNIALSVFFIIPFFLSLSINYNLKIEQSYKLYFKQRKLGLPNTYFTTKIFKRE